MRGTLLSIILMIIAAVMMGCSDSIIPCTEGGEECIVSTGGPGPDIDMVCNLEVSAQEKYEDMYGWMDGFRLSFISVTDHCIFPAFRYKVDTRCPVASKVRPPRRIGRELLRSWAIAPFSLTTEVDIARTPMTLDSKVLR